MRHCREQRLLSRSALVYHKVAEYSAELVHHAGDVLAALVELAQELNTPGNVPCSGHFCELIQMMIVGDPCAAPYGVLGDVAADCDTAVEQGKRVAHSAVGEPGYHVRSLLSKGDPLLLSYAEQPCGTVRDLNPAELEPLAAGKYRRGNLVKLRGRENEDNMRRRLLYSFQQRVERRRRKHVHLVEDIHAVLTANWRVRKLVLKLVNVADAAVAGSVQLDDISGFIVGYLAAAFALKAGISACRVLAVQRHCEYLRAGGLAGAAASGEQVCVGVLPLGYLVFQRGDYLRLGNNVVERSRTVFSI